MNEVCKHDWLCEDGKLDWCQICSAERDHAEHCETGACEECQECCTHDEFDHYICLYCGKEFEPADFFDEDYGEER